jgi:biopolymer transport protein ExbD/predicted Zn-dependent protease with MMP-like domain
MTIVRVMVCALVAGCMTPVIPFGSGKTAKQAQRDTMSDMGPARLATDKTWDGEITTKKIRVWADNEYRAQNRHWQDSFDKPLELANLVITPILGVRLVADYRVWERHVPGARLTDHVAALVEHDPGDDVFAVVGLTSSLALVSSTFEELGMAMLGGRHLMLRGYADLEERKLYANAFPDLRAEERELALVHLRHHKTAVVLLHELGHIWGVEHETDSKTIMHAAYSNHATAFSEHARVVMLRTIDQRLRRTPSAPEAIVAQPASAPAPGAAPAAEPAPRAPIVRREPIVIRVTKAGHTVVDGKRLSADALDALLKGAFADDPDTKIVIKEDRRVPAGAVGSVLDRAKAIGLSKFEFGWTGQ